MERSEPQAQATSTPGLASPIPHIRSQQDESSHPQRPVANSVQSHRRSGPAMLRCRLRYDVPERNLLGSKEGNR